MRSIPKIVLSVALACYCLSCSSTGEIEGKVLKANQLSANDVVVYTEPPTSSVLTDLGGGYRISDIQPGEYKVIARTPGTETSDSTSKTVVVITGNITRCDLSF